MLDLGLAQLVAEGSRCYKAKQYTQAVGFLEQALLLDPQSLVVLRKLVANCMMLREHAKGLEYTQALVQHHPNDLLSWKAMSGFAQELKQYELAAQAFQRIAELEGPTPSTLIQQGFCLQAAKKMQATVDCFARAESLFPDNFTASYQRIFNSRQLCKWDTWEDDLRKLRDALTNPQQAEVVNPYLAITYEELSAHEVLAFSKAYGERYTKQLEGRTVVERGVLKPGKKIRLGILSADFYAHATTHLLIEALEERNTHDFETILYSYKKDMVSDYWTNRCRRACEQFVDISELSDADAAALIARDQVDILIDLKGYTVDGRMGIQALRPAPVIVSWLGYPGTMGAADLADYIIGDALVTPPEHASNYSERLLPLSVCYQPNKRWTRIETPNTRAEAGLPEDAFVFCSFNQTYKMTPQTFARWCKVIKAVPDSILWLLEPKSNDARPYIEREFVANGLTLDRLVFAPRLRIDLHEKRLGCADMGLDTFPYTSHTTGRDLLWVGVPFVAKGGETFTSRVSCSLLSSMGLNELIAQDDEQWFQKTVHLATHRDELKALRARILETNKTADLFNPRLFANAFYRSLASLAGRGVHERPAQSDRFPTVVFEDEHLRVVHQHAPSSALCVVFGDMIQLARDLKFPAQGVFERQGLAALAFMPKSANWFPLQSMRLAIEKSQSILSQHATRVLYGGSMGAYAALKFSGALGASNTLALVPQWTINPEAMGQSTGYDVHWKTGSGGEPVMKEELAGHITLVFDPSHTIDAAHAKTLMSLTHMNAVTLPYTGHHATTLMGKSGHFEAVLQALLDNNQHTLNRAIRATRLGSEFGVALAAKLLYFRKPLAVQRWVQRFRALQLQGRSATTPAVQLVMEKRFDQIYMPLLEMVCRQSHAPTLEGMLKLQSQFLSTLADKNRLDLLLDDSAADTQPLSSDKGTSLFYNVVSNAFVTFGKEVPKSCYPVTYRTFQRKGGCLQIQTGKGQVYYLNQDQEGRLVCDLEPLTFWRRISPKARGGTTFAVLSNKQAGPLRIAGTVVHWMFTA